MTRVVAINGSPKMENGKTAFGLHELCDVIKNHVIVPINGAMFLLFDAYVFSFF